MNEGNELVRADSGDVCRMPDLESGPDSSELGFKSGSLSDANAESNVKSYSKMAVIRRKQGRYNESLHLHGLACATAAFSERVARVESMSCAETLLMLSEPEGRKQKEILDKLHLEKYLANLLKAVDCTCAPDGDCTCAPVTVLALRDYSRLSLLLSQPSLNGDESSCVTTLLKAADALKHKRFLAIKTRLLQRAAYLASDTDLRRQAVLKLAECRRDAESNLLALDTAKKAMLFGGNDSALYDEIKGRIDTTGERADIDIVAQLEWLHYCWTELQLKQVDDLNASNSPSLDSFQFSSCVRNRTTELVVAASHLLDQVYGRLVRRRQLGNPSGDIYFVMASSEKNFDAKMIDKGLIGSNGMRRASIDEMRISWREDHFDSLLKGFLDKCWEEDVFSNGGRRIDFEKLDEHNPHGSVKWFCEILRRNCKKRPWKDRREAIGEVEKLVRRDVIEALNALIDVDGLPLLVQKSKGKLYWDLSRVKECMDVDKKTIFGDDSPLKEARRHLDLEASIVECIIRDFNVDMSFSCAKSYLLLKNVQPYTAWTNAKAENDDDRAKQLAQFGTWLVKASAIANDAKHMRLVPQKLQLPSGGGALSECDVQVLIDYTECLPQMYDWTLYDAFKSTTLAKHCFKDLHEASRVLRHKAFENYFGEEYQYGLRFDCLKHVEALGVLAAEPHERQKCLDEFEKTVRKDVCKSKTWETGDPCMDVGAFADDAWLFVKARTLRLDPLESLSMLVPDFRIDVHEFIPKVLSEVRNVALVFGEDQAPNRESSYESTKEWSIVEEILRAVAASNAENRKEEFIELYESFDFNFGPCAALFGAGVARSSVGLGYIVGGVTRKARNRLLLCSLFRSMQIFPPVAKNVHLLVISELFDTTSALSLTSTLCKRRQQAGMAWAKSACVLASGFGRDWWWLVLRMREKAVRCLLLVGTKEANVHAFRLQRLIAEAYRQHGLFESARVAYSALCDIAPRDMDMLNVGLSAEKRFADAQAQERAMRVEAKRGDLDAHVYEQLQHCRTQLVELRYEAFRVATSKNDRHRLLRAMCLAAEIAVKCRHLLDQALTRFGRVCIASTLQRELVFCKVPSVGSDERLRNTLLIGLSQF